MLVGLAVLVRTAARATGRGLSTTPALATQPDGYPTYVQYTTAFAGAVVNVVTASANAPLKVRLAKAEGLIKDRDRFMELSSVLDG